MLNQIIENPLLMIVYFLLLLISIAVHEYSHAKAADALGDPTARLEGRLTLNPFSHVDLYGMLFLVFFGFGWGKPVPFDPFNLRNPRKDAAIISVAGPVSNFSVAILSSILVKMIIFFNLPILSTIGIPLLQILITLNVMLGVFNLLPISPLDGFKIVGGMLSEKNAQEWYSLERYGTLFLVFLIIPLGGKSMLELIIAPIISFITGLLI